MKFPHFRRFLVFDPKTENSKVVLALTDELRNHGFGSLPNEFFIRPIQRKTY